MESPARMIGQPLADIGMFVGGVVIDDGVDHLSGRDGSFDGIEEFDEFLVGVLGHAPANDGAIEDVEGGEPPQGPRARLPVG